MTDDLLTKDQIGEVITSLAAALNNNLLALSADEIEDEWCWRWEEGRSDEWNAYMFMDALALHRRRWRRWEEHHHGSCCVVEHVRDKYVMPRIRAFLAELATHQQLKEGLK